jgi:hypothetical protein
VLGQAEEGVGHRVAGEQLVVVDVAGEDDLLHAERRHQLAQAVVVALVAAVVADEQQPAVRLVVPLVQRERADEVVDALVRDDAADEGDVLPPVRVEALHDRGRRPLVRGQVEHDRQHAVRVKPACSELAAVVLAVAERQLGPRRERLQLAAARGSRGRPGAGGSPGRSGPA